MAGYTFSNSLRLALCAMVILAWALAGPADAGQKRVALVVGNSAYEHTTALENPRNDATDMAAKLQQLGFQVILGLDLTEDGFADKIEAFAATMSGADVALFYYAGHGLQFRSTNFLVPVDAEPTSEIRLKHEAINLNDIVGQMEQEVPLNLVFLDACRNNPLADKLQRSIRATGRSAGLSRGLARVDTRGNDTLITFAAAPGAVAADGQGRNSPFTSAVLKHIGEPGVEVEVMLKRVTADVRQTTEEKQEPERLSRLTKEFYFNPRSIQVEEKPGVAKPEPAALPPQVNTQSIEITFWNSIKESDDAATYKSYLQQFPNGAFAALAKLKIKSIESAAAPPPQQQVQPQSVAPPPQQAAVIGPHRLFPDSDRRQLGASDLARLSCDQLWVARNEIFDRKGYCFRTARGKNYFDNADCYTSRQDNLSRLERYNVNAVIRWERQRGCR